MGSEPGTRAVPNPGGGVRERRGDRAGRKPETAGEGLTPPRVGSAQRTPRQGSKDTQAPV